jgi:hypothetical protein
MKIIKTTLWTAVGLFGLAALVAMPAAADQVILDDLIVDGSACIGMDCVNGESFGFDTIRIKENNLRIKAQDTSSTASFPTQDWQLTFNDSSNGGANKFAVDCVSPGSSTPFTIEGCAPSHSLYVDDGGRVGFGTSTPVADLHVKSGNTPTLRLEQDGSSGFTPQTWDVAGNEANFFIRDATNGSTLPIRLRPGAPTSAIDIQANGDIKYQGDTNGDLQFFAESGTDAGDFAEFTFQEGTTDQWGFGRFGNADQFYIFNYQTAQYGLIVDAANNVGLNCFTGADDLTIGDGGNPCQGGTFSTINAGQAQFTTSSSRTIKENLQPVAVADLLDKVSEAKVYTYDFIEGREDEIGIMAEDFHQIFGRGSDKKLSGHEMQVALWLAVQELTAQNKALTERLAALEAAE